MLKRKKNALHWEEVEKRVFLNPLPLGKSYRLSCTTPLLLESDVIHIRRVDIRAISQAQVNVWHLFMTNACRFRIMDDERLIGGDVELAHYLKERKTQHDERVATEMPRWVTLPEKGYAIVCGYLMQNLQKMFCFARGEGDNAVNVGMYLRKKKHKVSV